MLSSDRSKKPSLEEVENDNENYLEILDPMIEYPIKKYCTYLLNKCSLPAYMPNYKDNNFLGLLIVNHMIKQPWVAKKMFNDPNTVARFHAY